MNQAIFERLEIDEEIAEVNLKTPFREFMAFDAKLSGAESKIGALLSQDAGSNIDFLMEPGGFEPPTPCLQSRCSTN